MQTSSCPYFTLCHLSPFYPIVHSSANPHNISRVYFFFGLYLTFMIKAPKTKTFRKHICTFLYYASVLASSFSDSSQESKRKASKILSSSTKSQKFMRRIILKAKPTNGLLSMGHSLSRLAYFKLQAVSPYGNNLTMWQL